MSLLLEGPASLSTKMVTGGGSMWQDCCELCSLPGRPREGPQPLEIVYSTQGEVRTPAVGGSCHSPYSLSPDGKGGREALHRWPEPDACLLDPTCRGWCFYMQLGQDPATQRPGFSAAPGTQLNVLPTQRKKRSMSREPLTADLLSHSDPIRPAVQLTDEKVER